MSLNLSKKQLICIAHAMHEVMVKDNEVHDDEKQTFLNFIRENSINATDILFVTKEERTTTLTELNDVQKEFFANKVCLMARADGHFCIDEHDLIQQLFKSVNFSYQDSKNFKA